VHDKTRVKILPLLSPVALTVTNLLLLYGEAAFTVPPGEMLRPMLVFFAFLGLLAVPIHLLTHDWHWTGISLGLLAMTLCSSAATFSTLVFFLLVVLLAGGCLALAFRWLRQMKYATAFFVAASCLSLLLPGIPLGRVFLRLPLTAYRWPDTGGLPVSLSAPALNPDIYYIVLDAYGREDILRDYYSFDNSAFISYLTSRGFVIPMEATSNYPKTVASIVSTLNMDYIADFTRQSGNTASPFWWQLEPYIDHSRVRTALAHEGYEAYAVATDWDLTDNRTADHYYGPISFAVDDFDAFVLDATPIGQLLGLISPLGRVRTYEDHNRFTNYNFTSLPEIAKADGPKFVFAHIVALHPPFTLDAAGNPVTADRFYAVGETEAYPRTRAQYRDLYAAQLRWINPRIEKLIDGILANSKTPPIIVLLGDHGPGVSPEVETADTTCVRERFSIFSAYYLPGLDSNAVPPDVSSVNSFRIILNQYFDARLPLLANTSYLPAEGLYFYSLEDVTPRLKQSCAAQGLP